MSRGWIFFIISFFSFSSLIAQEEEICVLKGPLLLSMVDTAPVVEECPEIKDNKECFKKKLMDFVQEHINVDNSNEDKIYVLLTISETAEVKNIQVKAGKKEKEEEIKEAMALLKVQHPARLKGKAVSINHVLVIE